MQRAIAAGHELTLETAKEILKNGGNAFDAAIAAYVTMFITEPCMASAGGNGFALTYTKNDGCKMFDFFCQTPLLKRLTNSLDFYPVTVDFGEEQEVFQIGLASAAVPGAIAAIYKLHEMYGTIPIKVLFEPARKLAKEGVVLNEFQAFDLQLLEPIFRADQSVQDIFFSEGKIKEQNEVIKMPLMDDFLDFIGREGSKAFYEGEISKVIEQDSLERGGFLRRRDFEQYEVNIKKPLCVDFNHHKLILPNSPSKGGLAMALMMGYLDQNQDQISTALIRTQKDIKDVIAASLRLEKFYPDNDYVLSHNTNATKGTSHFNIVDENQNAISLTSSIGEGCGYFIPGTNMHLNNMLGETFLLPNGNHSWLENTRLQSMMTPTLLLDRENKLSYIGGSGGASRIPYAIGQVIRKHFIDGMNLEEATKSPRVHYQDDILHFEAGALEPNKNIKHKEWEDSSLFFGGVHSISNIDGKLQAYGDPRRFGVAEIF